MRIRLRGQDLFYLTYGRGVPLLTCHGGPGLDHTTLRPWLDGLGDGAQLVYADASGSGRSGGRERIAETSLQSGAADIDALREHLGLERLVLFGHGFGGFVAQAYAHHHPERCAGLILCDATVALDYPQVLMENAQERCSPEQMAVLVQMLTRPLADDEACRRAWRQVLPIYFHRHDPRVAAAMDEVIAYSAAAYNHGLFSLAAELDTRAWLQALRCPTLVMAGRHDWLMPVAQGAERIAAAVAGAELVVFEESGHFPFVEEPVGFCQTVRRFLRRL